MCGSRPSVSRHSVVRADQHILPRADIILDAWQASPVRSPPIRRVGLVILPALPLPSIEENSDLLALPELSCQGPPQVRLIPRDDDETPYDIAFGLHVQGISYLGHPCSLHAGVLWRRTAGKVINRSLTGKEQETFPRDHLS